MHNHSGSTRSRAAIVALLLIASAFSACAQAPRIQLVGVHRPSECARPLAALQEELHDVSFPIGWTIIVACTPVAWDVLWRKAGEPDTTTAFTSSDARITVVNAAIFSGLEVEYRRTLEHERGHALCRCKDELLADLRGRVPSRSRVTIQLARAVAAEAPAALAPSATPPSSAFVHHPQ